MEKAIKKGAPPVGLWLKVGPDLALDVLMRDLRQIFHVINNGSAYEKNMHTLEISGPAAEQDFRKKTALLFEIARAAGIACIYRGAPKDAKELGADGVHTDSIDSFRKGRELFGAEGIAGIHCGTSSEKAAAAHDADADFVSFGTKGPAMPPPDALRFWTMLSDKPALIEGPVTNDYCAFWVRAGAGFIDAGDYIWSHGEGVMKGTVNMLYAIDLALEEQKKSIQ
ncbi:MAG: thiamine phosphate synthase [Proteobacteria bacterium]|nr:thiamine phosphate synthase [Pseudomonadota bacterium]